MIGRGAMGRPELFAELRKFDPVRAAAEARTEAAREAVQAAKDRIQEVLETTPEALLENLNTDAERMPPSDQVEAEVNRLKRQRDALGAVNLRAEEDAREVEHEHAQLLNEKTDLEAAIKALRGGIASLNREGRERLLTAFEQVNENFGNLFKHLFGGGEANLVLVESEDPLDTAVEGGWEKLMKGIDKPLEKAAVGKTAQV